MKFKLVKNESKYWEFIRELRLDSNNINGFLEKIDISKDDQIKYMNKYNDCYYVCLYESNPIGYIGVIDKDIRICTSSNYKQKGVGTFMLSELIKIKPEATAKILKDNIASLNLFKKCKFSIVSEDSNMYYLEYKNN